MSTWHPEGWSKMTRDARKAYREAHADEIAAAKKSRRQVIRRILAKAILEVAGFSDVLTGDEKFEQATQLALQGLDELFAFDHVKGELAALGAPAEAVTDWLLWRSPFRAWVEGEIQSLYESGLDELRKVAGE